MSAEVDNGRGRCGLGIREDTGKGVAEREDGEGCFCREVPATLETPEERNEIANTNNELLLRTSACKYNTHA